MTPKIKDLLFAIFMLLLFILFTSCLWSVAERHDEYALKVGAQIIEEGRR